MKRPCLVPALGMVLGIAATEWIGDSAWLLVGAAFLMGIGAAGRRIESPELALLCGWVLAGGLAWWVERTPLSGEDLRVSIPPDGVDAVIRGTVLDAPVLRLPPQGARGVPRTSVTVNVLQWREAGSEWQEGQGRVLVVTRGAAPETVYVGQEVEISGMLRPPPMAVAPGLFDYQRHLRSRGVHHLLDVGSFADWHLTSEFANPKPWSAWFVPWARRALGRGLPDDEATRLLWAMCLGWRTGIDPGTGESFVESGTMHVFAISGLHIALLAGFLVALLRMVRLPRAACGWIVLPVQWFYVAATGWQPSAVRSAVMMSVVVGGWVLRRPGDVLNSLAMAAWIILALDPGQLFQPGFQLSFAAVAGLAWWLPAWTPAWERALTLPDDPFLPDTLRPRWKSRLNSALAGLGASMALTTAAMLATLPLTIHTFHLLSVVSLPANLVIVPLSGIPLAAGLASLAVHSWLPGLSAWFNAAGWIWMTALTALGRWFARWPGGFWYLAPPSASAWVAYLGLMAALSPGWKPAHQRHRRMLWIVTAGAALVATAVALRPSPTRMTLLPGGAVVIDAPGTTNDWVLNSGGTTAVDRTLIPFLKSRGWNRLPRLAVTMADVTHAGGLVQVLEYWQPGELVTGDPRQRSPHFRALLTACEERGVPRRSINRPESFGPWTLMGPEPMESPRTAADNALLVSGDVNGFHVCIAPAVGPGCLRRLSLSVTQGRAPLDIFIAEVSRNNVRELRRWVESHSPRWTLLIPSGPLPGPEHSPTRWKLRGGELILLDPDRAGVLTFQEATVELETGDGTRRMLWRP